MGKTFQPGHTFPTSAGFTGSSGKVANISPYTRKVGKPKGGLGRTGSIGQLAASAAPPAMGVAPMRRARPQPAIPKPLGHSLQPRKKPVTQEDALHGGKSPLMAGYRKGGMVKDKC